VTTLQLAMAYAAVAGGGDLRRPRIVREIIKPDGTVRLRTEPEIVRRRHEPETAATLRRYLTLVVEAGTGKRAAIPAWASRARRAPRRRRGPTAGGMLKGGTYRRSSGFFPAADPRYALAVSIDERAGCTTRGEVAAPVFREIATAVLGPTNSAGGVRLVAGEAARPAADQIAVPTCGSSWPRPPRPRSPPPTSRRRS